MRMDRRRKDTQDSVQHLSRSRKGPCAMLGNELPCCNLARVVACRPVKKLIELGGFVSLNDLSRQVCESHADTLCKEGEYEVIGKLPSAVTMMCTWGRR